MRSLLIVSCFISLIHCQTCNINDYLSEKDRNMILFDSECEKTDNYDVKNGCEILPSNGFKFENEENSITIDCNNFAFIFITQIPIECPLNQLQQALNFAECDIIEETSLKGKCTSVKLRHNYKTINDMKIEEIYCVDDEKTNINIKNIQKIDCSLSDIVSEDTISEDSENFGCINDGNNQCKLLNKNKYIYVSKNKNIEQDNEGIYFDNIINLEIDREAGYFRIDDNDISELELICDENNKIFDIDDKIVIKSCLLPDFNNALDLSNCEIIDDRLYGKCEINIKPEYKFNQIFNHLYCLDDQETNIKKNDIRKISCNAPSFNSQDFSKYCNKIENECVYELKNTHYFIHYEGNSITIFCDILGNPTSDHDYVLNALNSINTGINSCQLINFEDLIFLKCNKFYKNRLSYFTSECEIGVDSKIGYFKDKSDKKIITCDEKNKIFNAIDIIEFNVCTIKFDDKIEYKGCGENDGNFVKVIKSCNINPIKGYRFHKIFKQSIELHCETDQTELASIKVELDECELPKLDPNISVLDCPEKKFNNTCTLKAEEGSTFFIMDKTFSTIKITCYSFGRIRNLLEFKNLTCKVNPKNAIFDSKCYSNSASLVAQKCNFTCNEGYYFNRKYPQRTICFGDTYKNEPICEPILCPIDNNLSKNNGELIFPKTQKDKNIIRGKIFFKCNKDFVFVTPSGKFSNVTLYCKINETKNYIENDKKENENSGETEKIIKTTNIKPAKNDENISEQDKQMNSELITISPEIPNCTASKSNILTVIIVCVCLVSVLIIGLLLIYFFKSRKK